MIRGTELNLGRCWQFCSLQFEWLKCCTFGVTCRVPLEALSIGQEQIVALCCSVCMIRCDWLKCCTFGVTCTVPLGALSIGQQELLLVDLTFSKTRLKQYKLH